MARKFLLSVVTSDERERQVLTSSNTPAPHGMNELFMFPFGVPERGYGGPSAPKPAILKPVNSNGDGVYRLV